MLFGVYLLIRKRAVLRYIYRLLAVYVSLLAPKGQANIGVLYHIFCEKSTGTGQKSPRLDTVFLVQDARESPFTYLSVLAQWLLATHRKSGVWPAVGQQRPCF